MIAPPRRTPLYVAARRARGPGGWARDRGSDEGLRRSMLDRTVACRSVWNAARRCRVRVAFAQAVVVDAAREPIAALDARTQRGARRGSIRAGRRRSATIRASRVMQQRYLCLDRSLGDERAAIDVLTGDRSRARFARGDVAASGRQPDDCGPDRIASTHRRRRARSPKPSRARSPLRRAARGRTLSRGGSQPRTKSATRRGAQFRRSPRAGTGRSAIRAHFLGQTARAQAAFRKCAQAATATGDDRKASRAWSNLAEVSSIAGDLKGVDDLIAAASGAAARSGDPRPIPSRRSDRCGRARSR